MASRRGLGVGQVGTAGEARTDHQHGSSRTWGAAVGVAVGVAVRVRVRGYLVLVWGLAGHSLGTRWAFAGHSLGIRWALEWGQ